MSSERSPADPAASDVPVRDVADGDAPRHEAEAPADGDAGAADDGDGPGTSGAGRDTRVPPGVRVTARARHALEQLRHSPSWGARMNALDVLATGDRVLREAIGLPPFTEHTAVDDPDLRCFLLAAECEAVSGRVPPALLAYHERADLRARLDTRAEEDLAERVEAWVGRSRVRPARSLRVLLGLRGAPDDATVTLQARLTSRRLEDQPRTLVQLRQLQADARREPGTLPDEHMALLELLLDPVVTHGLADDEGTFTITGAALLRLLLGAAGSPLVAWGHELPDELRRAAGVVPGRSPELAAGTVEIGPVLDTQGGTPRVVLALSLADGRVLREGERVVLRPASAWRREPPIVLTGGRFWPTRGEPPADLAELFASSGGLSLERARTRALVEPLARLFPAFRASIAGRTRVHPVRVSVCLDLRGDDWMQLRAFATGDEAWRPGEPVPTGAPLFEYTPDGRWARIEGALAFAADAEATALAGEASGAGSGATTGVPTATAPGAAVDREADVLLELPEPAHVDALVAWLDELGAAPGDKGRPGGARPLADDKDVGLWAKLTARNVERFVDAWERRPGEVAYYGNAAMRRLLLAPVVVAPRVRVESSGVDWFSVSADWMAEGAALDAAELAALRASGSRFVRLASGWTRTDAALAHDATAEALAELGIEPGAGPQRLEPWTLARARPEALAALEGLVDGDALLAVRELRRKVSAFTGLPRVDVPPGISAELRPYQRDGLDFLAHVSSLGLGAILADDMGLGKTLQALAWMARLAELDPDGGPCLVVCPASVVHNWQREAARFAPGLRVLALAAGGERQERLRDVASFDLVVTTYALLRRDLDELREVRWRAVVLDEAQNVKNPDAQVSRAARELSAPFRLALTGTPLENRALDLWSILAFLNPGYLGTRAEFAERFERADAPGFARRLLAAKLRPVLLRRLKAQVAPELPPRIEERLDCELLPEQRKLYLDELGKARALVSDLTRRGGLGRHRISILTVLTRLRQICCHPALAGGRRDLGSGKFEALFELLEPLLAEGHKVLVFSQFVRCLELLAARMDELDVAHHLLTGATKDRGAVVSAFDEDERPAVFLVSLRAGGTGLNLTAASYVVLFDPWWNPAVEAQAIDRTHRIGQDKTVIAYRMVAQGTLEERILELQERKASLARDLLGEDGLLRSLTREDLDYLLADLDG